MQRRLVLAAAAFLASASVHATIINGGFEQGLLGWEHFGDVSTQTSSMGVAPTEGSRQALLTTLCSRDLPGICMTTDSEFPYTTTNAVSGSRNYGRFLGLSISPDAPLMPSPECGVACGGFGEGSAIARFFYATAGQTLLFDWNYISVMGGSLYADSSHFTLVSFEDSFEFEFVAALGGRCGFEAGDDPHCSAELPTIPSTSDLCTHYTTWDCSVYPGVETGYSTFAIAIPFTGMYRMGFVVWESAPEGQVPSALLIDNVRLVPEPAAWPLFLLGASLVAALGWRGRPGGGARV